MSPMYVPYSRLKSPTSATLSAMVPMLRLIIIIIMDFIFKGDMNSKQASSPVMIGF